MANDGERGYARGRATREEILEVASRLFAESGYYGTSLREIAAACGITHPGLLHHFPTKAALLAAVLERRDREDTERFELQGGNPANAMLRITDLVAFNQSRPHIVELYTALSAEATSESHPAHEYFIERYRTLRREIAKAVRAAQDEGMVRADLDPDTAASAIGALMDGLQIQWLLEPDAVDMADVFRRAMVRVLEALPTESRAGAPHPDTAAVREAG